MTDALIPIYDDACRKLAEALAVDEEQARLRIGARAVGIAPMQTFAVRVELDPVETKTRKAEAPRFDDLSPHRHVRPQLVPHKIRLCWPFAAPHTYFPDPPENVVRRVWRDVIPRDWKKRSRAFQHDATRTLKQYGEGS